MCGDCLAPFEVLPSSLLFNMAFLALIVLVGLAGLFLFRWPPVGLGMRAAVFEPPGVKMVEGTLESGVIPPAGPQGTAPSSSQGEATPTPTNTPTPPEPLYYIVEPGDALLSIADRFGVRAEDIRAANNLEDPHRLSIGQRLLIPRN